MCAFLIYNIFSFVKCKNTFHNKYMSKVMSLLLLSLFTYNV